MSDPARQMTPTDAEALFAELPPVTIAEMAGDWTGWGIETGHPLQGPLVASGWVGKRFRHTEADPLVMRSVWGRYRLNPGLLPLGVAMALRVHRWPLLKALFAVIGPILATRRPRARLRCVEHQGVVSAAMIYDQKPIIDHFRRLDERRVMGKMDRRGDRMPFYFVLERKG